MDPVRGRPRPAPEAAPPASARPGWRRLLAPLLVAAATLLAYSNSLGASFHLDDWGIVVQNDRLLDLGRLWPPGGSRWLGEVTFALNHRLGGDAVTGFHLVNLAIHLGAALLVSALAAATLDTPAARQGRSSALVRLHLPLAAGLLFALHPLATQAVTYLVQRFTSLATLLYLLALLLYVRARLRSLQDGRWTWRAATPGLGAVLAAAAAMKTKEISVTLPLVVVGYELLFFPGGRRRRWLLLAAPLAATALIPLLDPTLGQRLAAEATIPRLSYALTQWRVVVTYLRLLLWPAGQNLDYDFPLAHAVTEPAVLASLALLLAVAALGAGLVALGRRTGRVEGLLAGGGIAWFFVTLSVESSVIPIRDVIFEHRVYLPGVGAALALGTALLLGVERLRLRGDPSLHVALALALVTAPLGGATWCGRTT